jgi:hypothetical protein
MCAFFAAVVGGVVAGLTLAAVLAYSLHRGLR